MVEIRIVSLGKTCGYPDTVCKKYFSLIIFWFTTFDFQVELVIK